MLNLGLPPIAVHPIDDSDSETEYDGNDLIRYLRDYNNATLSPVYHCVLALPFGPKWDPRHRATCGHCARRRPNVPSRGQLQRWYERGSIDNELYALVAPPFRPATPPRRERKRSRTSVIV